MPLTLEHRKQIAAWFCIIFYALMIFKWFNGLFLYQLQPFIFSTRFDFATWLLMNTGLHNWLLDNSKGWLIFDVLFYSVPLLYYLVLKTNVRLSAIVACIMLVVNWIYVQCYTVYPSNSIEGHVAWLLFPFLFISLNVKSFYFILQALRYFFLFFFFSAGVWKLVQHGALNMQQMSGVLLYQHKEFLISSPGYWYTNFTYWLVSQPKIGYFLYASATALELCFIVGFFTKKLDRWLIFAFILFLLMDILIMRIHYWELFAFIIPLVYSKHHLPGQPSGRNYKK